MVRALFSVSSGPLIREIICVFYRSRVMRLILRDLAAGVMSCERSGDQTTIFWLWKIFLMCLCYFSQVELQIFEKKVKRLEMEWEGRMRDLSY